LKAVNEELIFALPGVLGGKVKALNEIAYSDDQGEMQFLRRSLLAGAHKFDASHTQVLPLSMLKHFRENINFVEHLVCIGYSFGDFHINTILIWWLELSSQRRLVIVDPFISGLPTFLLRLLPQISVVNTTATEYLDEQASVNRTNTEKLEKHLAKLVRSRGKKIWSRIAAGAIKADQKRLIRILQDAIRTLPINDGKPNFDVVGGIHEFAKKISSEHRLEKTQVIMDLIRRLEEKKK
jgi:hypothetical protein